MRDFKKELDQLYQEAQGFECSPENKLEYIGDSIFGFTTYDGDIDSRFASRMISVLKAILNKENFDYIKDESNYENYLLMVNMPFLKDKLEWGTSIRGAWFNDYEEKDYKMDDGNLVVNSKDIKEFIKQLIEWSEFN